MTHRTTAAAASANLQRKRNGWRGLILLVSVSVALTSQVTFGQQEVVEEVEVEEAVAEDVAVQVVQQPVWTDAQFDQWVFQQHQSAAKARQWLDSLLKLQTTDVQRACELTDAQQKKLQLAGRGDIKRFFNRYEAVKRQFSLVKHDRNKFQEIWQHISPLQMQLQAGLFHSRSFMQKSLSNILNEEQLVTYQKASGERSRFRHRAKIELAVAVIEQSTPLSKTQRETVIEKLLEETKPLRYASQYEYYALLYQISRIPEKTLKPLFDDVQWPVVGQLVAQGRGMEQWLRQTGQLVEDDEVKDDEVRDDNVKDDKEVDE